MPAVGIVPLLLALPAGLPPLTAGQRGRLETALDGRDYREEAFVALLENARGFSGHGLAIAGDRPVRLEPDLDALLADPGQFRGSACRLEGVLQQATALGRPYAQTWEWFLRTDDGRPLLAYVTALADESASQFVPGRWVSLFARYYKPVDAVARDGRRHRYPAFVGARPWLARRAGRGAGNTPVALALAAGLLIALLVVLALLAVLARRRPPPRRRRVAPAPVAVDLDEPEALPDDPAEALVELKRRAEEQGSPFPPGPAAGAGGAGTGEGTP